MPTRKSKQSASEAALAPQLIYIHGIGKHPPVEAMRQQWDLALFGRDAGAKSTMAYWSDLVHPELAPAAGKRSTGRRLATDWRDQLSAEARARAARFERRLMEHLGVEEEALAQPSPRGPGKKVLPLPEWLRKPLARAFVKAFIADTSAYFFAPGMRQRVQKRLREQLQAADGRPITLVAHSQGSIVAYEVLAAAGTTWKPRVEHLVTIGSPLGIQELQDLLEDEPLRVPDCVRRWSNFADPLDPVALDKGLAGDFEPSESGTRIRDDLIVNKHTRKLIGFNPHSAVGYLAHPKVREAVHASLGEDSMGRFVVARDVAELLATDDSERHPVLIEVLEPGYRALGEDDKALKAQEARERQDKARAAPDAPLKLQERVARVAQRLESIVQDKDKARIDPLKRFVSAHLTATELQAVAQRHQDMRVYAVWKSTVKRKLTDTKSISAIKADAGLASFGASGAGVTWAVLDTGIQADWRATIILSAQRQLS